MDIGSLRREFGRGALQRANLNDDPLLQFEHWFKAAEDSEIKDPSAMSLATAAADGEVSVRTVLLKLFDRQGFVFFTNYSSEKARQIDENSQVALLFPWLEMDRQVIIKGQAARIPTQESLRYFLSRPRGSQLGAWVSQQSSVISSREMLMSKFAEIKQRFGEGDISLPEFWGGYRVAPTSIEFWQGQANRLHDRFRYTLKTNDEWIIERLAP